MQTSTNSGGLVFHFSSVKKLSSDELVAAPLGQGIVHKKQLTDEWIEVNEGLPEQTHINRLQAYEDQLYACSNKGLFVREEENWEQTQLCVGCYQYKQFGEVALAGTSCGLWYTEDSEWHLMMRSDIIVYDFLYLPQYVVLGTNEGLSILDRMTSSWMNFNYGSAVTSLAVYHSRIVGATEHGDLLVGNQRGGFERYAMGKTFVFSVVTRGQEVFACTDRGLYRISHIRNQIALKALKIGCQVTDVDLDDQYLYIATLFEGVQRLDRL
ncbi:hypothetical protein [Cohnella abietis]|uniref:Uncharacterized protein n=1 Tax=Cohnella abietis TaxID=2507935 RepID=A0A3T1D6M9_9BACL|nr:hypothetical protein [Cohnella abietis]BBI33719.1 hypothetical protein KCTCHS21_31180 [Cohnella abietis]